MNKKGMSSRKKCNIRRNILHRQYESLPITIPFYAQTWPREIKKLNKHNHKTKMPRGMIHHEEPLT